MTDNVLLALEGPVATVTLNRPDVLNVLDRDLAVALHETLRQVGGDEAVRCVVLNGAGNHFMAGGDLAYFRAQLPAIRATAGDDLVAMFEHVHGIVRAVREMPKPVVASARGAVAGFGLSLLMACDLAVVAEDSVFTMAYCHIGASPDGSSSWFLPRVVGLKRASELALLGERFDAQRAAALGLVNQVVASDELGSATAKLAARLVRGPAFAYAQTKALLNASAGATLEQQLERERDAFVACALSDDFAEGVTAFCEKRKPDFA